MKNLEIINLKQKKLKRKKKKLGNWMNHKLKTKAEIALK